MTAEPPPEPSARSAARRSSGCSSGWASASDRCPSPAGGRRAWPRCGRRGQQPRSSEGGRADRSRPRASVVLVAEHYRRPTKLPSQDRMRPWSGPGTGETRSHASGCQRRQHSQRASYPVHGSRSTKNWAAACYTRLAAGSTDRHREGASTWVGGRPPTVCAEFQIASPGTRASGTLGGPPA